MAQSTAPADQERVEALVGNPGDRFIALADRIQDENIQKFRDIEPEFLEWLWCVDAYRANEVVPRGPQTKKKANYSPTARAAGSYRQKGDRFSDVLNLILSNKTPSKMAPRRFVKGYSQDHQIDIAWPIADKGVTDDPIICCESKITGAPADSEKPDREINNDWTNRRKELKFQATDLKLFQGRDDPKIRNWDQWRRTAPPLVFAIWAGRLTDRAQVKYMVDEARNLTDTYLDRVGVYPFITNDSGDGYVAASVGREVGERITSIDTVLQIIVDEIEAYKEKHPEFRNR